ncbi:hypothetical protein ACPOL_4716 [Acidisarcina polymorpha]|uniref:RES domain-containing protein n=1 Tax=Acidisarcina polymorpha TaxID=2211140 RepID=A0A2Z5G5E9_9BACT|nr:RES family NAD+ phosphorylase [Acidisarcina polymorpha]AXC13984.1 hypothetical protein ACPOL_4716 [Acidisarcina polymorpha]
MAKGAQPPSTGTLRTTLIQWGEGQTLHRVHSSLYQPDQFNPSNTGDARFSPLLDNSGTLVPTLYAGTTLDCALMETVFHDVPFHAGFKTLSKVSHVDGQVSSAIRSPRHLRLIDLTSIALKKLGVRRCDLIDTEAAEYPITRKWAARFYGDHSNADGLLWTSRQDDRAQAVVLFEPRLKGLSFIPVSGPESLLLADGSARPEVLNLADRLDVVLV